jgi:hypothetical protein
MEHGPSGDDILKRRVATLRAKELQEGLTYAETRELAFFEEELRLRDEERAKGTPPPKPPQPHRIFPPRQP